VLRLALPPATRARAARCTGCALGLLRSRDVEILRGARRGGASGAPGRPRRRAGDGACVACAASKRAPARPRPRVRGAPTGDEAPRAARAPLGPPRPPLAGDRTREMDRRARGSRGPAGPDARDAQPGRHPPLGGGAEHDGRPGALRLVFPWPRGRSGQRGGRRLEPVSWEEWIVPDAPPARGACAPGGIRPSARQSRAYCV